MKRGEIKRFREYLNAKYRATDKHQHNRFHQLKREYGDYLYAQDRAKFDVELQDALAGIGPHVDYKQQETT